jgi:hypothetical protein
MLATPPQTTTQIDESISGIKVTARVKKDWLSLVRGIIGGLFLASALLVAIPFGVLIATNYLDDNLLIPLGILAFWVICILGLIRSIREVRDFTTGSETIEIDESGVKIEKQGLFKQHHFIPADRIRGISLAGAIFPAAGSGSLISSSHTGSIWIWTTNKLKFPQMVGSGLSSADALLVLQNIQSRYPQYKFKQTIDDRQAKTQ